MDTRKGTVGLVAAAFVGIVAWSAVGTGSGRAPASAAPAGPAGSHEPAPAAQAAANPSRRSSESVEEAGVTTETVARLVAIPEAVAPIVVAADPLARALLGDALDAELRAALGREPRWRAVDDARQAGARVASGSAEIALTAERFAGDVREGLDVVELGDLVLVVVARREVRPPLVTGRQLQGLLTGRYRSWRSLRGTDAEACVAGLAGLPVAGVELLCGEPAALDQDRDAAGTLAAVVRQPGAFGIVDLATLESLRQRFAVDDLVTAIDGVRPSLEAYRAGRYAFGARLRLVTARDASVELRRFVMQVRARGVHGPLGERLCAP